MYPPTTKIEINGKEYQILLRDEKGGLFDLNYFKERVYPHIKVIILVGDPNEPHTWISDQGRQGQESSS